MLIVTRQLVMFLLLIGVKVTLGDQSVESVETVEKGERAIVISTGWVTPSYEPNNDKNPLGKSFYLPALDLYSSRTGGSPIFSSVDPKCILGNPDDRLTNTKIDFYEDTQKFYNSIASSSSLDAKITGKYTMGTTLNVKTSSISSGEVDVRGNTLRRWTHTQTNTLDDGCYRLPSSPLSSSIVSSLQNLPLTISNPQYSSSWRSYDTFLNSYGSHMVSKSHYGASIRSWVFSKKTKNYSKRQFQVSACVNFEGPTEVGKLGINACTDVTQEEIRQSSSYEMSFNIIVQGGTDATRNSLTSKRTKALMEQLMNEGRANPSPVDYEYVPIWEIIKMKFSGTGTYDKQMTAKAENLRQYYEGYQDFGCSKLVVNGVTMRQFRANSRSTSLVPQYECWLGREGCRTNHDCHVKSWTLTTHCYGSSCMVHRTPGFGTKAKYAVAQTSRNGSYKSGVNRTCYYKSSKAQGYCNGGGGYYFDSIIWP